MSSVDKAEKPENRRRVYLVYPEFQSKLIGVNTGVMTCGFLIVAVAAWWSHRNFVELGVAQGFTADHVYFTYLDVYFNTMLVVTGLAAAFTLALCGWFSLRLSFRLAGPVHRLVQYFRGIAQGDHGAYALSFRRGDYYSELPEAINQALVVLAEEGGEEGSQKNVEAEVGGKPAEPVG